MVDELKVANHTQLRNVIADRIRSAILDAEIKPGDWLRQEQLAEKFGVSQTPVREALKDLAAEGLLDYVPYRGVRVAEFSLQDALDLYACRAFMEGRAARYAAQHITLEELTQVEQTLHQLDQTPIEQNVVEHRKLHRRFHQLIYTASRRMYLVRALDQMWASFPTMMLTNFSRTAETPIGRGKAAIKEHHAIVTALKMHKTQAAERLMRDHIETTAQSIAKVIRLEPKEEREAD